MTVLNRRSLFLLAGLLVVFGAVIASQWDARNRVAQFQDMMESQGRAMADIVAESSIHGLNTFNSWENEVNQRLVNNALWLVWLDTHGGLDAAHLNDFALTMGLHRILVFAADGALEASSHAPGADGEGSLRVPTGFLDPLLTGAEAFRSLGFKSASRPGERRILAGAARLGGGAIVVNIKADDLLSNRQGLGPGHLIKSLGEGQVFRYIVIQDRSGIQASSTSALDFSLGLDAPYLLPLENGARWVSREFSTPAGGVFEVSRKLALAAGPHWLRVGLDATLLAELRRDTRNHALIRLAMLLGGLFLVAALAAAWQRQSALDSQVVTISAKLRRHEAEARRREKLVAMGSLGAGVAHQIRNPLNSIHMIAQVLDGAEELPAGVRDQVRHIRDESARIEDIVQRFLIFTKPRKPVFEILDLAALVRDVVDLQAAALTAADLTFSTYAPGLQAEVDRRFMIEILENLLRNAAQAMQGPGKVLVSLIARGEWAEIVVADNGPGVPAADRERIFDLYFTTRPEGTGLGLSLTAQMVAAMAGQLSLDTEPGLDNRGARFVVRLPLRQAPAPERTS
jgi:signal transduction histidine kinase